ncbi:MAG: fructose-bisphosphatase, class II [Alphaproteobacteria bacterium 33-17]|nr:MAG: fructose-bisphosphatase, class II [Alphaproteobacteria bacterium 33-17]
MILNSLVSAFNSDHNKKLERLIFDAVYVTESAAVACYPMIGKGDEKEADQQAVNAMRAALNKISISGKIVIGEGERDEAPMLYIGEEVGCGDGPSVDIAVDPLEGTTLCAHAAPNSIAVMAMGESGTLLNAPDVYMDKIAVGIKNFPKDALSLDNTPGMNLKEIARFKNCDISELSVMILNRPRHQELIAKVREAGARVMLIKDGDVAASIATTSSKAGIDAYMGIGGAPEGVLAAAALKVCGGHFLGRLLFSNEEQQERLKTMGTDDFNKQYTLDEMVKGDVIFVATGVTTGSMLKGITKTRDYIKTHSIVMHYETKTIRNIHNKIYL